MSIPIALSSPPHHWSQSGSSFDTAPKPGALLFQLAMGIFVGLVQRFVAYHHGFDRLTSGLLSSNGIILALDGVFGTFGGMKLELDSPPPLPPVVGSGPSPVEAQLQTEDLISPLEYIESDGYPRDATYPYASLACVVVALSAGVWLVQRRAAGRNVSTTPSNESGGNGTTSLHNSGVDKPPSPKWKQNSNGGGSEGNHNENPKGDDVSEDDDDDDDDPPPPPPGSGSEFRDVDDEGLGNFWKIASGNILLGSIVMSIWKFLRESRRARNSNDEHGPETRSFGETIGMERYQSEWDILMGNSKLPRHNAARPSLATPSTFLTTPAVSFGPSPLALSANESAVATQSEARKNSRQVDVGTVPILRRKAATRYMWVAVSKLKPRLGNLVHDFVEAFGLMTFAMLFVFPVVLAFLGLVRGGEDYEEEVAQDAESVGAFGEEAKGGDGSAEEETDAVNGRGRLEGEALLDTLQCRKQDDDGDERFVYLDERLYAPCTQPLHDIREVVEPVDSNSSNLEYPPRMTEEDDDDTEMISALLQTVFLYHEPDGEDIQTISESPDEARKVDDEDEDDDLLSDVDSYLTAEEDEVDDPMDVDELVRGKIEPCLEQTVLGVSGRLHESIWEDSTIVGGGSTQLFQGGLPKPQVAFPLWSTSNLWAYNPSSAISNERVLPSDAFAIALAMSTNSNAESTTHGIYMTPPQADTQAFPGSPPAVPRGRKLRLREKLMREWEARARETLFYDD